MSESKQPTISSPVVVNLGKVRKKRIRQLKKGRGKLMNDVGDAVAEVVDGLGEDLKGKEVVPVVIVYREKRKKRRRRGLLPML